MRRLGWVMFGVTGVLAVGQGVLLLTSGEPFLSYDVFIDQGFPLLTLSLIHI